MGTLTKERLLSYLRKAAWVLLIGTGEVRLQGERLMVTKKADYHNQENLHE